MYILQAKSKSVKIESVFLTYIDFPGKRNSLRLLSFMFAFPHISFGRNICLREREREMSGRKTRQPVLPEIPPSLPISSPSAPAYTAAVCVSPVFSLISTTMRALILTLVLLSLVLSLQAKRSTLYQDKPFGEFQSIKRLGCPPLSSTLVLVMTLMVIVQIKTTRGCQLKTAISGARRMI